MLEPVHQPRPVPSRKEPLHPKDEFTTRMTDDDANRLAIRYHNIWRGGPTTTELTQHFLDLDLDRLETTLTQLSNTHDYPPTIATIHTHYTNTTYGWPPPEHTGPPISIDEYLELHDDEHVRRTRRPR